MTPVPLAFLGTTELIIVLVIVVIFFGLGKLPQVGKQLGEGIRNFKDEVNTDEGPKQLDDHRVDADDEQTPTEAPRDVTGEA